MPSLPLSIMQTIVMAEAVAVDEELNISSLRDQRQRYVEIRADSVKLASVFKNTPSAAHFEELVKCTDGAIASLDSVIALLSEWKVG